MVASGKYPGKDDTILNEKQITESQISADNQAYIEYRALEVLQASWCDYNKAIQASSATIPIEF